MKGACLAAAVVMAAAIATSSGQAQIDRRLLWSGARRAGMGFASTRRVLH
jgi:hypothetical protein